VGQMTHGIPFCGFSWYKGGFSWYEGGFSWYKGNTFGWNPPARDQDTAYKADLSLDEEILLPPEHFTAPNPPGPSAIVEP
jgi:hypothetical protein